ncbi:MAG: DUF4440 domain-containing protein [Acidobacteriaceae bacterium]
MPPSRVFTYTSAELLPILEELRCREPIFHRRDKPATMAPGYWEVGASGRRYSRQFILQLFTTSPPVDALEAGWLTSHHAVLPLSADNYLFTYTLQQSQRVTRRATIWQQTPTGWQVLFHQRTIATTDGDDVAPAQS